jgi:hypothetical protein
MIQMTPQKNNDISSCIDQELQQARQELQVLLRGDHLTNEADVRGILDDILELAFSSCDFF